jgi:predicted Zn-dependent peptidase
MAIVGDVDAKQVRALAEKYFSRIPAGEKPEPLRTVEPTQQAERRVLLKTRAQRLVLIGYHKPNILHPDNAVYDAITSLLSEGRSSRLHEGLVTKKKVAVQAAGFSGFPGEKYPGLFLFYAFNAPGKSNEEVEKEMMAEIERLKNELVSDTELEGVKNRARAGLLRLMADNTSMGMTLASYQAMTGDWRNLFKLLDKINAVTPADVQRVAKTTFTEKNRSVGYLEPEETK